MPDYSADDLIHMHRKVRALLDHMRRMSQDPFKFTSLQDVDTLEEILALSIAAGERIDQLMMERNTLTYRLAEAREEAKVYSRDELQAAMEKQLGQYLDAMRSQTGGPNS